MALIVAARFDTFDEAAVAARQLFDQGFTEDDIHTFYINTAGEHARFPIGGDRVADPDAKGGHFGAVAGASVLGLLFALGGLWAVRQRPAEYASLAHLDGSMLLLTFVLAIAASLLAGILPAWRAMQVTPALQLKSQ